MLNQSKGSLTGWISTLFPIRSCQAVRAAGAELLGQVGIGVLGLSGHARSEGGKAEGRAEWTRKPKPAAVPQLGC